MNLMKDFSNYSWQAFLIRLVVNSLVLGLAIWLYSPNFAAVGSFWQQLPTFLLVGVVFSFVNTLIRPLIVFLSLPALLLTLGLFTIVINGLVVYLTLLMIPSMKMSLGSAIFTGIILSIVNYILNQILSEKGKN